jgi:hypothetical protein
MAKVALARKPAIDEAVQADEVLVHVRFLPNAEIFSIDEKPQSMSAREWLNLLLEGASPHYQALAGGRGFFRIPRAGFETILGRVPN